MAADIADNKMVVAGVTLDVEHDGALYRLKEDDPQFGLNAGDILRCVRYPLDPNTKLTVLQRKHDGYDPHCNVYRHRVERIRS